MPRRALHYPLRLAHGVPHLASGTQRAAASGVWHAACRIALPFAPPHLARSVLRPSSLPLSALGTMLCERVHQALPTAASRS
eukprot:363009-Chlamydomonas_euryale.AAC.10